MQAEGHHEDQYLTFDVPYLFGNAKSHKSFAQKNTSTHKHTPLGVSIQGISRYPEGST